MKQAHIYISGFVQGVGFRDFIKRHARRINIRGFVTNLPDGRVEAVFQGEEEDIKHLIDFCKTGPFLSEVEDAVVEWEDAEEIFDNFQVRH